MANSHGEEQLSPQVVDYVASAVKGIVGAAPFAGSLLAEIAGTIIPNQRIDRIAAFASVLELRLSNLELSEVRAQLDNKYFTDLIEEGIRQASRSLSDERREYIASLIANSLSLDEIEYIEAKHLMKLLGELNDIEIIWLRSFVTPKPENDNEFREKHSEILTRVRARMKDSPSVFDKETLQNSYFHHLLRLGLLYPVYEVDQDTRYPVVG